MISTQQLAEIFPATSSSVLSDVVAPLSSTMDKFSINTTNRMACFIAQVGYESGGFNHVVENLNYSAKALLSVFPKYFDPTTAAAYERKPEKIANRVYANRMGNLDEASGDGWKYRGRGFIQLTGKNNYMLYAHELSMDSEALIEYAATIEGACVTAGLYWDKNNLNALADKPDMTAITKRINGGDHGLQQRINLFKIALTVL